MKVLTALLMILVLVSCAGTPVQPSQASLQPLLPTAGSVAQPGPNKAAITLVRGSAFLTYNGCKIYISIGKNKVTALWEKEKSVLFLPKGTYVLNAEIGEGSLCTVSRTAYELDVTNLEPQTINVLVQSGGIALQLAD